MKVKKLGNIYKYSKLNTYEGLLGKTPMRAPTTYVGVEIELEKVIREEREYSAWRVVKDGSLKDNGKEFVTVPIKVQYLEVELDRLFSGIIISAITNRCSVHVHLNVRDFTLEELEKFLMLYTIFEKSLYNITGNRNENLFCVPLYSWTDYIEQVFYHLKNNRLYEKWSKYHGLNLCPIYGNDGSNRQGTVEFRHLAGCVNKEKILQWINIIVSLKIGAKSIPINFLREEIKTMNTTSSYTLLAHQVFREYAPIILNQSSFKEDVESGVTFLKSVYYVPETSSHKINLGENTCVVL